MKPYDFPSMKVGKAADVCPLPSINRGPISTGLGTVLIFCYELLI